MDFRSLTAALKRHALSKTRMLLFLLLLLFIIFEILSFAKVFTKTLWPTNIFSKLTFHTQEKPIGDFRFQTIAIETPFVVAMTVNEPIFPDRLCSVADYGALADGKTSNTIAFQKAIDACANAGGGKVNIPPGVWLTGPIHLKSNINLHIERDATLLFSTNLADYLPVVFSRFEGIEYYNYSPPLYATDATNVAVTGSGTLDGQGAVAWWKLNKYAPVSIDKLYAMGNNDVPLNERIFGTEAAGLRPAFIEFVRCNSVLIEGVKIKNGPMWTIHPLYSDNVIVRDTDIATTGPNTDGIAIDSSSHVLIENIRLTSGDDAIALKSGRGQEGMRLHHSTENVVIRNSTIKSAHGAVAIGSEMSGDVRNVLVSNIDVGSVQYGFRIKTAKGRGGTVENVWVENMRVKNASIAALEITAIYGSPFRVDGTALPTVKNVHLKNVSALKTSRAISVIGLSPLPISSISFEDMTLWTRRGVELVNTDDVSFKNIQLTPKDGDPLFEITNSSNISIENAPCAANIPLCLSLKGATSSAIDVRTSGFEKERTKTLLDVDPQAIVY